MQLSIATVGLVIANVALALGLAPLFEGIVRKVTARIVPGPSHGRLYPVAHGLIIRVLLCPIDRLAALAQTARFPGERCAEKQALVGFLKIDPIEP